MKSFSQSENVEYTNVTLCVRVWIEIGNATSITMVLDVTLCVRVWIEIAHACYTTQGNAVTLCVRVWIEIVLSPANSTIS